MERKEITSKKETQIRTKQGNKTESSEKGLLRKTKSESTIESSIIKTELLIEKFSIESHSRQTESSSNHLEMNINNTQEPSRERIPGGDFNRLENLQLDTGIEDEEGQGDVLHVVESTGIDNSVELDGFSDNFISEIGIGDEIDKTKANDLSCFNNNDDEFSLDQRCSNSHTSLKILAWKYPHPQSEKRKKEIDLEHKISNLANKDELSSTDINITVTTNINYANNPLMESNIVNGVSETVSIPSTLHDGEYKVMEDFKSENVAITETSSNANKGSIQEDDGCFSSSEDNDEKEELDTEILEKSVRYLVSYFENLKNTASRQNKVRTSKSKRMKMSDPQSDKTEKKIMAVKEKSNELTDSSSSFSLNKYSNFSENIAEKCPEITPDLDKGFVEEKSVTMAEVPHLTSINHPHKPVITSGRARRLCSPTIKSNFSWTTKQVKRNQEHRVRFSEDAIALKSGHNASEGKFNKMTFNKHKKPLLKHPCFSRVISPLNAFSNRNTGIYSSALLFNRRVTNNLDKINYSENGTANNENEVLKSSDNPKEIPRQETDHPEDSSNKKKKFITKKSVLIVLSVAAVIVHVVCIFYIR